jgi:hypothetical protein
MVARQHHHHLPCPASNGSGSIKLINNNGIDVDESMSVSSSPSNVNVRSILKSSSNKTKTHNNHSSTQLHHHQQQQDASPLAFPTSPLSRPPLFVEEHQHQQPLLPQRSDYDGDDDNIYDHPHQQQQQYFDEKSRYHQPQPQQQQQAQRRVRFNKTIYNRRIPHLNNMSERFREAIWIQPEEYMEIRNRCIVTVKMMMRGELPATGHDHHVHDHHHDMLDDDDIQRQYHHCTRGLEGKTRDGASRRKEYKLDSIAAVLDEQQLQWEHDDDDDEAIMEVYQVFTIPCAQIAYEAAKLDEEYVQNYVVRGNSSSDSSSSTTTKSTTTAFEGEDYDGQHADKASFVQKLSSVVGFHGNRAAMLEEIERNFYEESSIERRKKHAAHHDIRNMTSARRRHHHQHQHLLTEQTAPTTLAEQVKAYFQQVRDHHNHKVKETITANSNISFFSPTKLSKASSPSSTSSSLSSSSSSSLPPSLVWDEESSSLMSDENSSSFDSFTTELSDVFYARKKRQSLLSEIEGFGSYIEPTIISQKPSSSSTTTTARTTTSVTTLTQKLSTSLTPIFWVRKSRQDTLRELGRVSQV